MVRGHADVVPLLHDPGGAVHGRAGGGGAATAHRPAAALAAGCDPSEEPAGDLRDEGRDYTALVAFAAVFLVTAFFWHPIASGIAFVFWHWPARSSTSLAYIDTIAAALLGATVLAWVLTRIRGMAVWRPLGWAYVGLAAGVCVAFLPIVIDIGISPAHYYQLMWLPSWI